MTPPKPHTAEMNEGVLAFKRFREAAKKVLSMPKSALPPDPFTKQKTKASKKKSYSP